MKERIRIQGIFIFLAAVFSMVLAKFIFPQWKNESLDEFLDALGLALILFGFLLRICARGWKAESSAQGNKLVSEGIYGIVRHPMYFGTLFIGLGIVLVLLQWWAFLIFMAVFMAIYVPQVKKEERLLSERFGREYAAYCAKVPKYLPSIASLFKKDIKDYLYFKWSWIKKELLSLSLVIGMIMVIEVFEDVRLFGNKVFIKEILEFLSVLMIFLLIFSVFARKKAG